MSSEEFVLFEVDRETGEMAMHLDGIVEPSQCHAAHQIISEELSKVGIGEAGGGEDTQGGDKSSGVRLHGGSLRVGR
jgi:hypothetical protein